jgi:hypothetical protein
VITFAYKDNKSDAITTDVPSVKGFYITNLKVTGSKNAGKIIGLPESHLQDIVLTNLKISAKTGLIIENAKGVILKNVKVKTEKGKPVITTNVEGSGF